MSSYKQKLFTRKVFHGRSLVRSPFVISFEWCIILLYYWDCIHLFVCFFSATTTRILNQGQFCLCLYSLRVLVIRNSLYVFCSVHIAFMRKKTLGSLRNYKKKRILSLERKYLPIPQTTNTKGNTFKSTIIPILYLCYDQIHTIPTRILKSPSKNTI